MKAAVEGELTSDWRATHAKSNKPTVKAFEYLLKKHNLKAEECMSVGDHAQTDLYTPKKMGFSTVWIKQGGYWATGKVDYNYIYF